MTKKHQFKTGDTVMVRNDLNPRIKSKAGFVHGMLKYAGQMAKVTSDGGHDNVFHLNIDKEEYWWDDNLVHLITKASDKDTQAKTFLKALSPTQQKIIKDNIKEIIENRKEQLKNIEENILIPMERIIRIAEKTQKGNYPIEYLFEESLKLSKYLTKLLNEEHINTKPYPKRKSKKK